MADYGLVMPFVVCQSKGGPYDDESYVAGFEAGYLDGMMAFEDALRAQGFRVAAAGSSGQPFHAANAPQIDLIAMRHNYSVAFSEPEDGWVSADFTKAGS